VLISASVIQAGCFCPPPQKIKPNPALLEPAQKNDLTPENTIRDAAIEYEFRGKEIDKVNLNLEILGQ